MYLILVVAIKGNRQALYQLSSMILEGTARYGQPLAFAEGFGKVGRDGGGTGTINSQSLVWGHSAAKLPKVLTTF